jgi:hypothetical protein
VDKTFEEELTSDPKQGEPLSGIGGPIGNGNMDPHVVAHFDRRSPAAAQYRTLRTNPWCARSNKLSSFCMTVRVAPPSELVR